MTTPSVPATPQAAENHAPGNRLGSFLCWAVVFADIGTSVYYTPGILYGLYGPLAGFFVLLTLGVFILLTLKYAEVTQRFPEGGGVVTVTSHALSPWAGALGGMLILVDYFLTAALSSLSGVTYFTFILPRFAPAILVITLVVLLLLGLLNWWGIKESASVSAVIAVVAFISDLAILLAVAMHVPIATITRLFAEMFAGHQLTFQTMIAGYAGAFLAFSGLESISQLSPVMRVPRKKIAGWALGFVVVTVGITSPLLTVFSTTLLCAHGQFENGLLTCVSAAGRRLDPNQFISLLGGAYGGPWLGIAVAISAAALLIFASNTAIIGSYHVFLALTRMQFFPPVLTSVNRLRGTPHWAILLATVIPVLVLIGARGQINLLGDLYAFGLLGAFTLTCLGIDILRWREASWRGGRRAVFTGPSKAQNDAELAAQTKADAHRVPGRVAGWLAPLNLQGRLRMLTTALASLRARWRGMNLWNAFVHTARRAWNYLAPARAWLRPWWEPLRFGIGVATTVLVAVAWGVNLVNKHLATEFGGGVTVAGLAVALTYQVYREVNGEPTIHPLPRPQHYKNAWLVILPTGADAKVARKTLVQTVAELAGGHTLIFAYLDPAFRRFTVRSMLEIADPWAHNQLAQRALSKALISAWHAGVPRHQMHFYFAPGGPAQVTETWRGFHPEETIALAGQGLGRLVQVEYLRTTEVEGTKIAFYSHHVPTADDETATAPEARQPFTPVIHLSERAMSWMRLQRERFALWLAERAERRAGTAAAEHVATAGHEQVATSDSSLAPPVPAPGTPGGGIIRKVLPTNGHAPRPPSATTPPARTRNDRADRGARSGLPEPPPPPGAAPPASHATADERTQRSAGSSSQNDPLDLVTPRTLREADQYVWTGTELKRRDELPGARQTPADMPEPPNDNDSAADATASPATAASTPTASTAEHSAASSPPSASAASVVPITPEASVDLAAEGDAEPEAVPMSDDPGARAPAPRTN